MKNPSYLVFPIHLLNVSGHWSYDRAFDDACEAAQYLEFFGLPCDLHWHPTQHYFVTDAELTGSKLFDSLGRPVRLTAFESALLHLSLDSTEPSPYAVHILEQAASSHR